MAVTSLVRNQRMEAVELSLGIAVGTDLADILTVKEHDVARSSGEAAPAGPSARAEPRIWRG
jgi:hypothetical protein